MARPKDADSAVTYDAIIEAALDEIRATTPRDGISLRKVAARAGLTLGAVQYYFQSKDRLLEACLDDYHERLVQLGAGLAVRGSQAPDDEFDAVVCDAAVELWRFVQRESVLLELRAAIVFRNGGLPEERVRRVVERSLRSVARDLARRLDCPESEAFLTLRAFEAIIVRMTVMNDEERARVMKAEERSEEVVFETFVRSLARRLFRTA